MTDEIREMILNIRSGGRGNMLDIYGVQHEADSMGYYSLVLWIEEHRQENWNFIMTGNA
jgi:hypothetical protein